MRTRMSMALFALLLTLLAPVAASSSAEAATVRTWDRLAHCESTGRWHIASGNGYYGGLQFSPRTWGAFGGRKFARQAHKATRLQQIKVAERVKRAQGWGAWPSCSRRIGLR
jgi:resuscitation-promoting factor RpfA